MHVPALYEEWFQHVTYSIRHLTLELYKEVKDVTKPYSRTVRHTITYNHDNSNIETLQGYADDYVPKNVKNKVLALGSLVSHSTGRHLPLFDCDGVNLEDVGKFRSRIAATCGPSVVCESSSGNYHVLCMWAVTWDTYEKALTELSHGCVDKKFINVTLARHQGTLRFTTRERDKHECTMRKADTRGL